MNKTGNINLSKEARQKLMQYTWPGNVRELKAVIDLACLMMDVNTISAEDLTFYEVEEFNPISMSQKTLKEYEVDIITHFLKENNQNVIATADHLEISKSKIYNLIKLGDIKL